MTAAEMPEELTRLVWTLHRRLIQSQRPPTGENVRPPAQVELLRLVAAEPGITVRQAAAALRMQAHNVSSLVTVLVKDGYFTRVPDPADRRYVQLHPTAKMHAATHETDTTLYAGVAQALAGMPGDSVRIITDALPELWKLAERLAPSQD
ncbi:MarR family winged helix-turn-helix transcriptional regulator [Actinoplanes derwentensis]|nr:helix-turn-helix domain-containing protein [Actinoplanes derwentensis]GID90474.1 MarR family transcriptional regulator [Actinoplanes derwentensis]